MGDIFKVRCSTRIYMYWTGLFLSITFSSHFIHFIKERIICNYNMVVLDVIHSVC